MNTLSKIDYEGEDVTFKVSDYSPHTPLAALKNHCLLPEIQKCELIVFYYHGVKLPHTMTFREVQNRFQENDRRNPVTLYLKEANFKQFSSRQIKDHFNMLYLTSDTTFYETRIAK